MKKEFFNELYLDANDESHLKMRLSYYLLIDKISEEYCDLTVYGVEIDKTLYRADGMSEEECKILKDLFFKRSEAEMFMEKLVRNKVTPMGLKYAVSEHIDEQIGAYVSEG